MHSLKKLLLSGLIAATALRSPAQNPPQPIQNDENYQVYLDLRAFANDALPVQIIPPILREDSVEFHLPRIIPGTYSVYDFGRFVRDIHFLSSTGDSLAFRQISPNRWRIYQARELYAIRYWVEDTYDGEVGREIFEPAGTSLADSVFLLNNFGIVGYIDAYKQRSFQLSIAKPRRFYGSTALAGRRSDTLDQFALSDYFQLHDNPLLYCRPDTISRKVGGAEIRVSVYSPNKLVNATECMEQIAAVLEATAQYLGGTLPVDRYAVLIYTAPFNLMGDSYGALEHMTSTVLFMPEFSGDEFYRSIKDITAHEFFHIVTPLSLHSEHIANFDFIEPEMSRHLWLYEGVTEYNSHLVQVRHGLYDLDEFLEVLSGKMSEADSYNPQIPLTQASRHTLDYFKSEYLNFYEKGALAAMALDLKLIALSDGEMNLIDLLQKLYGDYGPDTSFVDRRFFDLMSDYSYPELRGFFARHYESAIPFPFDSLLAGVGIRYYPSLTEEQLGYGGISFGYNFDTERFTVADTGEIDAFGRELGFRPGDEIIDFNGYEMNLENIEETLERFYANLEVGDKVKIKISRLNDKGEAREKTLKAKARMINYTEEHVLRSSEEISDKQQRWRRKWLNEH